MKTVHDIASACGGGFEFGSAAGSASRNDSDFVGDRGEHRSSVEVGEQL